MQIPPGIPAAAPQSPHIPPGTQKSSSQNLLWASRAPIPPGARGILQKILCASCSQPGRCHKCFQSLGHLRKRRDLPPGWRHEGHCPEGVRKSRDTGKRPDSIPGKGKNSWERERWGKLKNQNKPQTPGASPAPSPQERLQRARMEAGRRKCPGAGEGCSGMG